MNHVNMEAAVTKQALVYMIIMVIGASQFDPKAAIGTQVFEENDMEKVFKNPSHEYRMIQIVHSFTAEHPTEKLAETLDRSGYGGVVANVGFTDYLESEKQWDIFLKGLADFRARGMVFWLYDEKGYPSGKAGGLTLRDHPEYECLGVLCARTEGKGTLQHKMPVGERIVGSPLSVIAAPIQDGKYDLDRQINLTDRIKQGQSELIWDAPDGKWGILSFHVNRMYEGTHCVANLSDTLPYINIMDRDAVARFIQLTHEAYKQRCGGALRDYVRAIFTDEPSLMTLYLRKEEGLLPPIPWSRNFREEFRSRYNYDILPELPRLFVDCGEKTVYSRLHFWKVVAELIEENFYGQIQDWCRANGIKSSGHALCEEHLFWHAAFEGDLYRDLRRMDIPGIDMLSSDPTQLARARHIPIPKFVSSVTHIMGGQLCMSETSSHVQRVQKIPCSFEQRLGTINWQYVLGLTCVTSYYGFDEFNDDKRKVFNDHIGRLGTVLTGGRHVADIAVFYPIHSFWGAYVPTSDIAYSPTHDKRARRVNDDFGAVSAELLANQQDFDYIDDQAVLESKIGDGCLEVAGEDFKCIILPNTWVIPAEVYQKLEAFVNSGGVIIALGGLPDIGMSKDETYQILNTSDKLAKSDRVAVVQSISDVVDAVGKFLEPDVSLDPPCREFFYLHRRRNGKDIYFLCNCLDTAIRRKITFHCTGKPELWHPTTGEIRTLNSWTEEDRTTIIISLKAFEGVLIVFSGTVK